jgi:hypothetical protein
MKITVQFFKDSGKWYTEESVEWQETNLLPHDNMSISLRKHFEGTPNRLKDMLMVCIDVPNYCPMMGRWDGWRLQPVEGAHGGGKTSTRGKA